MKLWWNFVEGIERFWFTRLFPPTTDLRFEFPPSQGGREREKAMFVRRGRGDVGGMNAEFVPEIKLWCKLNLKKGYSIHGSWDMSTYLPEHDIEMVPWFVVRFKNERDAILFKLKWT
jgi:hypothetical protein